MLPSKQTIAFVLSAVACVTPSVMAQSASAPAKSNLSAENASRIRRIEQRVAVIPQAEGKPPITLSLPDLMEKFKVPALSIAVIDNFQIVWAKGYGVIAPDSKTPVTTKTLFQAGSISKPVAATAALYMVEQDKLVLDENVNDRLKTWKVPDNEFTQTEKVTLRRLAVAYSGADGPRVPWL